MSVDWNHLGQARFDRTVEALIRRKFIGSGTVTVVDGRGGDGGVDILLVTQDGRRRIFQLKYFPEGFSSGWAKSRRAQIKKSYTAALKHKVEEWTLVVPTVLTVDERAFVGNQNGGTPPPIITTIGRTELDDWLADDPNLDTYLQRDAGSTLREMARDFNQERAALLGGMSDVAERVRNLGRAADTMDPDWTVDFARLGGFEALALRAQHPDAAARSPIGFTIQTRPLGAEDAALRDHIERELGYGTSVPVVIPGDAVQSICFTGPEFIAGEWPPGEVRLGPFPYLPSVGKRLEIKLWHDDDFVGSFEGEITHAGRGDVGGTVDASFYDGRLTLAIRLPHDDDPKNLPESKALRPGINLTVKYGADRPDLVADVLAAARCIRGCTRLEIHVEGDLAATMEGFPPITVADYGQDLITIEQFAGDLAVVQRHCNQYFGIPEYIHPGDRVAMRVARLLVEGHLVASPAAQIFTVEIADEANAELREHLRKPRAVAWRSASPYEVTVGDRTLMVGEVYAVHSAAVATNADEAIEALDAGKGKGFKVQYRPGDDPFFYLVLADRPVSELRGKKTALWGLVGVDQPGIPDKPQRPGADSEA